MAELRKSVLLLGANGQTGQAVRNAPIPKDWQLHSWGRSELDIAKEKDVFARIPELRPDIVINCAAMTNVDACERDEESAREVNFLGPANIAVACAANDIPVIHISTDYVFDGTKQTPYVETDEPHAINTYGFNKMLGEDAVRGELAWHVILRVSWVMSAYGENVLTKLFGILQKQPEVKMVADQSTCPTPADSLARAIIHIGQQIFSGKSNGFGTFHFAGTPAISRFEFARYVAGLLEATHGIKMPPILPCKSDEFPSPAKRPPMTALDCSKIEKVYGIAAPAWQNEVASAVASLVKNQPKQVA